MIAENSKLLTRNLALGKLALAEAYLGAGKYEQSGDAARQSLEITDKLFGRRHQDAAHALHLLALVDWKAGCPADAKAHGDEAIRISAGVFGESAPVTAQLRDSLQAAENTAAR